MLNEWVESFKAPFLSSGIDLDMSTTLKACHIRTYLNELALVSLEMKPRDNVEIGRPSSTDLFCGGRKNELLVLYIPKAPNMGPLLNELVLETLEVKK